MLPSTTGFLANRSPRGKVKQLGIMCAWVYKHILWAMVTMYNVKKRVEKVDNPYLGQPSLERIEEQQLQCSTPTATVPVAVGMFFLTNNSTAVHIVNEGFGNPPSIGLDGQTGALLVEWTTQGSF